MGSESTNYKNLLDTLGQYRLIKALVIIDSQGRMKARRGHALSLQKNGPDNARAKGDDHKENIYLAGLPNGDFAIVIFDTQTNFEAVKKEVDDAITSIINS